MEIDNRRSNVAPLSNNTVPAHDLRVNDHLIQKNSEKSPGVNVEISPEASQKAEDSARLERLNAIRQQLAEGTYSISGKDVADKILKIIKN